MKNGLLSKWGEKIVTGAIVLGIAWGGMVMKVNALEKKTEQITEIKEEVADIKKDVALVQKDIEYINGNIKEQKHLTEKNGDNILLILTEIQKLNHIP